MRELEKSQIVIDASFLLKLFLPEEKSDSAEKKWKMWIKQSVDIVAPTLIIFEVSSVLRNKVYREIIDGEIARSMISELKSLDISLLYTEDVLDIAWEIGDALKSATLYDCFYIAVAKFLNTTLWTADKKLYTLAKKTMPFVNLL